MLFKRQKFDWILVALLALGLFIYASYQPRFRLRPTMPADFIDLQQDDLQQDKRPAASFSHQPRQEEKIARAYWNCLVEDIQWKYGYGHILPVNPPPEFTDMDEADPPGQSDPDPPQPKLSQSQLSKEEAANRVRYWRKAQHAWLLPTAWQKDYEWDFSWTTNWLSDGADAVHHFFQHLGGS